MVNDSKPRASHSTPRTGVAGVARTCATLGAAGFLAACASGPVLAPIDWWHDLQGGAIAEQRPAPPGSTDPYPLISSVPPQPAAVDRAALAATNRDLRQARAEADDLSARFPVSPAIPAIPAIRPAAPVAAAPASGAPSASLDAKETQALPAAPPPPPALVPTLGLSAPAGPTPAARGAAPAALPVLPAAAPSRPALAGVVIPANPSNLLARPAQLPGTGASEISVTFDEGSSSLAPSMKAPLQRLASRRGHTIMITGRGEATANAPSAQQAALNLALARAQVIAEALVADGVPRAALRLDAQPAGRGASIRLLD